MAATRYSGLRSPLRARLRMKSERWRGDKFGWQKAARKDAAKRSIREANKAAARSCGRKKYWAGKKPKPKRPRTGKPTQSPRVKVRYPAILPAGSWVIVAREGELGGKSSEHKTRRDIIIDDPVFIRGTPPGMASALYCGFVVIFRPSLLIPIGGRK